jgi:hypothetical protein
VVATLPQCGRRLTTVWSPSYYSVAAVLPQCGRRLTTVWPPSYHSVVAILYVVAAILFTVWPPQGTPESPHTHTSHPTDSAMPTPTKELGMAIQIILATPNEKFSVRTLQALKEKFDGPVRRRKPRKEPSETRFLTGLSTETGNDFVKAVAGAEHGAEEHVTRLWARVEQHLIKWEIVGNPGCEVRKKMSRKQRSYRSTNATLAIEDLDQQGRDFLMLLAYARVDPMPQETFNLEQQRFSWLLGSCTKARMLLHDRLIKNKFLKRVFSAITREWPTVHQFAYADYGKRALKMAQQALAQYQESNSGIPCHNHNRTHIPSFRVQLRRMWSKGTHSQDMIPGILINSTTPPVRLCSMQTRIPPTCLR